MNITEEQHRITLALHSREHTAEETDAIEAMRDRAYSQFAKALRRVAEQAENSGTRVTRMPDGSTLTFQGVPIIFNASAGMSNTPQEVS